MELKDLTAEVITAAIEGFYQTLSRHLAFIAKEVGNESMSVPRIPRKMGTFRFTYFFAAELDQIFRFALGGLPAQKRFVLDLCALVERLLFSTPHGERVPVPDAFWNTTLGFAMRAAQARVRLRFEDQVSGADIALLCTLSPAELDAVGLAGPGPFAAEAVRTVFEKHEIPA